MTAKQRKLYELRQRMNLGRTLNHTAVLDEKKREDNPDEYAEQARRKQIEQVKHRREEEEIERRGPGEVSVDADRGTSRTDKEEAEI